MSILDLLESLFQMNASDPEHGPQQKKKPEIGRSQIRTLAGTYKPLSPMLEERFLYAGAWENANLSQNWLSQSEIDDVESSDTIKRWIELRYENWSHCPPSNFNSADVAIFGVNPFEPDETYLVWRSGQVEPEVWTFFGADYHMFTNLKRFFMYYTGILSTDDTVRVYQIKNEF